MADAEEKTRENDVMNLVFAFNYGARREIVEGARTLASRAASGDLRIDDIDEDALQSALYIPEMPDVDLIIRSSGEHRISNFLLWQAAYAEFYFPGILWPDFDRHALLEAVVEYQARDRRFGAADDKPDSAD
ncbi:MAG: polyprenyl diphosphate synthase, partial [Acidimicrobiia bacterium]